MLEILQERKKEIDDDLLRMSEEWRSEWREQYGATTYRVLNSVLALLNRGGKRIRGSLAMESYFMHGGTDQAVALGAARVIELVQAQLLVMDDIQDNTKTRRGAAAVHIELAAKHGTHYGVAQALNAELLAANKAITELMDIPVADSHKVRATRLLNENITTTVVGQITDLHNQQQGSTTSSEEIIQTLTWKTAYYTFVSPLELGACLAGEQQLSERLKRYALAAGVAFQISDDNLGVFGDSNELGKSADDDIREGKATLLTAYAYQRADREQRNLLDTVLGKRDASTEECDHVRQILAVTGAREYAAAEAGRYRDAAIAALGDKPEDFLVQLVQLAVNRSA